jgi:hypothetical protein
MVVPTPNRAISANDQRKLAACAIKPFKGRPIKNLGKLIVETAANANRGHTCRFSGEAVTRLINNCLSVNANAGVFILKAPRLQIFLFAVW